MYYHLFGGYPSVTRPEVTRQRQFEAQKHFPPPNALLLIDAFAYTSRFAAASELVEGGIVS